MTPVTLWAALAFAAPVNPFEEPDESELFRLDEHLVTVASRYEQTLSKAPGIIHVMTADDIRDRGFQTVSEALRSISGVYVWESLEGRDLAAFRGIVSADNNKVLLLLDGTPLYDGVYNHAFLDEYLPVSAVAQIEVIKGPGSVVYGTNAFAGIVSIRTFDATRLDGARVRWQVGSDFRSDLTVSAGGRERIAGRDVRVTAFARMFDVVGDGLDETPRGERDLVGFDPKRALNLGARVAVDGFEAQLFHADHRHVFLPSEVVDPLDAVGKDLDNFGLWYHTTSVNLRWTFDIGTFSRLTPWGYSQYHDNPGAYFFGDSNWTVDPSTNEVTWEVTTVETEKRTRRLGAGLDLESNPGIDHRLLASAGLESIVVEELADYVYQPGSESRTDSAFQASPGSRMLTPFAFMQYTWAPAPQLELVSGLRMHQPLRNDTRDWTVVKPQLSPRLALLYVPSSFATAKLLYGNAFRAANSRELFVTLPEGDRPFASSNPNLVPERIDTVEAQLSLQPAQVLQVSVQGFYSQLRKEIDKNPGPEEYVNIQAPLRVSGTEVDIQVDAEMVRAGVAWAMTLARYGDGGLYANRQQYEFPPHMGKGYLSAALSPQLSATVLGEVYSRRPRTDWSPDAGVDDGAPFGLMHLELRMRELGKEGHLEITGGARNLTNARWGTGVYRDDANRTNSDGSARFPNEYAGPGRQVHLGLEIAL